MKTFIDTIWNDPAAARKFFTALLGAVVVAVSVGLLPAAVGGWVAVASSFLTAYGVYRTPNAPIGRYRRKDDN